MEIEVLQKIQHPNIVGFFGAMETKNRVYLIFELVQRGNLLTYLKTAGPVGESSLSKKWFAQLAGAMTFVHRKEIAHRYINMSKRAWCNSGMITTLLSNLTETLSVRIFYSTLT